jgi:hypothetical protein
VWYFRSNDQHPGCFGFMVSTLSAHHITTQCWP